MPLVLHQPWRRHRSIYRAKPAGAADQVCPRDKTEPVYIIFAAKTNDNQSDLDDND